jgi:hypothetical protein
MQARHCRGPAPCAPRDMLHAPRSETCGPITPTDNRPRPATWARDRLVPTIVSVNGLVFSSQFLPKFYYIKEDYSSHQNTGKCMKY